LFDISDFNTYCYKSWQALAVIHGNFRGMKIDIIWACPLKQNLPCKHQEQIFASVVALFSASLLALCYGCMAAVASFGRLLAQQPLSKVLRRAFRYNRSRGQQAKAFLIKITFSNTKPL